mmetsp:Transcript_10447/g.24177  ORF Transcript_10447/g.24177 Transcript_10447/m.24177 type:complete len:642 (+) Transcript_10447:77-2002(+)
MAGRSDRWPRERSRSYRDRDRGGWSYGSQPRDRREREWDVRDARNSNDVPAFRRDVRHGRGDMNGRYDEAHHDRYANRQGRGYDDWPERRNDYDRFSRPDIDRRDRAPDRDRFQERERFPDRQDRDYHRERDRYQEDRYPERERYDRDRYPERDGRDGRDRFGDRDRYPEAREDRAFERDRERDARDARFPERGRPDRDERDGRDFRDGREARDGRQDRERPFRDERPTEHSSRSRHGSFQYDEGHQRQSRHGEDRHVERRGGDHVNQYQEPATHSRSQRVRKLHVKERKPDVRQARDHREPPQLDGPRARDDGRERRPDIGRRGDVQPGSGRLRRMRDVRGEPGARAGRRPAQRPGRERKAPLERGRLRDKVEQEGRPEARRPEAAKEHVEEAAPKSEAPPTENQGRKTAEGNAEKPPASGAVEREEGETDSSESSSSDECNSQADFSGSEAHFPVAVAEEADEPKGSAARVEEPREEGAGQRSEHEAAPRKAAETTDMVLRRKEVARTIPVPKSLCKQISGAVAESSVNVQIQDHSDPCIVTVSGQEEDVEHVLGSIRALGDRNVADVVELCVAKNMHGQTLQGLTEAQIRKLTQTSVTFRDGPDDYLHITLEGPHAAVDRAWLLVVKAALGKDVQSVN